MPLITAPFLRADGAARGGGAARGAAAMSSGVTGFFRQVRAFVGQVQAVVAAPWSPSRTAVRMTSTSGGAG